MISEQLSFVLPIARNAGDTNDIVRLKILLLSFLTHFAAKDLSAFWVITPAKDLEYVGQALKALVSDDRFRLVSELEICPDEGLRMPQNHGGMRRSTSTVQAARVGGGLPMNVLVGSVK
jgi:hypothetical protein